MKRLALLAAFILLLALPSSGTAADEVAPLPCLEEGIKITDWWVVGPFLSGSRESLVNPLGSTFDYATGSVDLTATYPSVQEFGGKVAWQSTTVDSEGNLSINFSNPNWDKIDDEWGASGMSFSAGAYATFQCDMRCRALVDANGAGSFYINGRQYTGDPYGHGLIQTPVILDEGENRVFLMTGGYGGSDSLHFEILPAPETEMIVLERDIMMPDIVRGEALDGFAGVPILNTTERWLTNVTVNDQFVTNTMAPLSVLKTPVRVWLTRPLGSDSGDTWECPIVLEWWGGRYETTAKARVRNPEDSRIVTFISQIDHSVQKYAVRYPVNFDPARKYSLILTTHGAGVECEGQVDAFEAKDWAFVVAPTNRRRFGFDWQDWGRLDAIEVLDRAQSMYPIDPDRVYLIGHSMGGHGAWHIGCTHADRFAAIVPSAGWASFQLYTPWFLRSDDMFFDPNCERIFNQCAAPDRTEHLLPNLRNVPVLAVQGGDDDNVPPTHARLLTGMLDRMGYDVRYWEEPGQGHWWDKNPNIPGADCVDALRIRSFCRERVRDPYPRHVTFVSYDLGNNNSMYWITVDQEISPIGRVYVDAELTKEGVIVCKTENVAQMGFHFGEDFPYPKPSLARIDGQEVTLGPGDVPVLYQENWRTGHGEWKWVADNLCNSFYRRPDFRGPIKRAYFEPFIIVVGQSGSEEQNELNMDIARNLSQRWWYRANGRADIIPDSQVERIISHPEINIILVGGPESNSLSAEFAEDLPMRLEANRIGLVGSQGEEVDFVQGEDLACQFVYRRPDCHYSLVHAIWGNSLTGMRLAGGLTCLYSGSDLPDFIIYDEDVRLYGFSGVRAAGFFNDQWFPDPEYCYVRR